MKKLTKYQQTIYDIISVNKYTFVADEGNLKSWYIGLDGLINRVPYSTYLGLFRNSKLILKEHFKDMPLGCMVFEYLTL